MKKLFLISSLLFSICGFSQSTLNFRADSSRFFKQGGNHELVIENTSKGLTGSFLKNRYNGRTEFAYAVDSAWYSGDTIYVRRGDQTLQLVGISSAVLAQNGVQRTANTIEWGGRFSSARNISGGGQAWTMDSLGSIRFVSRSNSSFKWSIVGGTSLIDSTYIFMQRGVSAATRQTEMGTKAQTAFGILTAVFRTQGGTNLSSFVATSDTTTGLNVATSTRAILQSNTATKTSAFNVSPDSASINSPSLYIHQLRRNSGAGLRDVRIDTATMEIFYGDDGAGGAGAVEITDLIAEGSNIDITGSGTLADPYVIGVAGPLIADNTIYNADGFMIGTRRVGMNNHGITWDSSGLFRIRDTAVSVTGGLYGGIYDFSKSGIDFVVYDSVNYVGYTSNTLNGHSWLFRDFNNLDTNNYFRVNGSGFFMHGVGSTSGTADSVLWRNPATGLVSMKAVGGGGLTVGTTTIASGTSTRVGFNDAGVYNEDAGLTFNKTTDVLTAGTLNASGQIIQLNGVTRFSDVATAAATRATMQNGVLQLVGNATNHQIDAYNSSGTQAMSYGYNNINSLGHANLFLQSGSATNMVSIGGTTPTSKLFIAGGTATLAPFKINSGTNLTTPESGAGEYNGEWYLTKSNNVRYGVGGTLESIFTDIGNVGSGEDNLHSFSIPAGTLSADGDYLEVTINVGFAANTNSKKTDVEFGATTIFTGTTTNTSAGNVEIRITIIRTGATTQRITTSWNSPDITLADGSLYFTASETLSGAITLKTTGEAVADNDIIARITTIKYFPAN